MSDYIGLDVSLEDTHICAVDGSGAVTVLETGDTRHFWRANPLILAGL
jgi:hypothetical protein